MDVVFIQRVTDVFIAVIKEECDGLRMFCDTTSLNWLGGDKIFFFFSFSLLFICKGKNCLIIYMMRRVKSRQKYAFPVN